MEYEGIIPRGALLGAKQYGGQISATSAVKQSEARELLSRLTKLTSELSNTYDLASNVADKIVGSRPEPVGVDTPEAMPSPNFLSELRAAIARLEDYPGDINSLLNRIAQSF